MTPTVPELSALLERAVAERVAPALQACVIVGGEVVHSSSHGALRGGAPVGEDCRFDVASVTKLATTLLAAQLVERGALDLDAPVARTLPDFGRGAAAGKDEVTARHLLAHTSGLPAWRPLFERCARDPVAGALFPSRGGGPSETSRGGAPSGPERARAVARSRGLLLESVLSSPLAGRTGDRVYSDLGFIALGRLVEELGGASLAVLARRELFAPLGLGRTGFVDLAAEDLAARLAAERFAPTGGTRPREPAPGQEGTFTIPPQAAAADPGEVDDDNAYALGGIAGHAGLFSTAAELARLGQAILDELDGAGRLRARRALEEFVRPSPCLSGPARGLGFDLPARSGSAVGEAFGCAGPRGAVGHLGFTGCSLWLDLDRRISAALVTNRVAFGRANVDGIRRLRPDFHDRVAAASRLVPPPPA